MADDITYTDSSPAGVPNSTKQVTDEHVSRGHMPVVKLAYSADGDATQVPADASGLLVNLGANNDVTVTGTVTATLSATDNAVLDAIESDTTTIAGAVSGTEMQVDVVSSALPSGAATSANQSTVIGHLDGVEGLLTTIDSDTSNLSVVGGGTEAAAIRVTIANNSTGVLSVDDNGGSLTVDGTVAATQSGTWNVGSITTLPSIPAGSNNIGDVDIASGTVTTVTTLTGGGVAHDSADSGNPHKVGGRARTSDVTAVANDDRIDQIHDSLGAQVVRPYALHENLVSGATSAITDTTSTSVIASAGASTRNYITSVLVTNSHATVGTTVTITDGSGGTALYRGYAAPVGGGFAVSFPTPLRGSAATAVHAVCGTTGSNVYVSASGYKAAV